MDGLKPIPLAYQIVGFFKELYLKSYIRYNEACLGMPKAPKITIEQSLRINVLDLLDFFNAVVNSSKIQGSIQEVVNLASYGGIL